jgi:hypothetical protein
MKYRNVSMAWFQVLPLHLYGEVQENLENPLRK